jgi:DNA-binding NtrC family response regulator
VRELENALGNACMMVMGEIIDVADLPENLRAQAPVPAAGGNSPAAASESETDLSLEEQERLLLVSALERAGGNQSQAARILRISRDRMRYKMSKHNLR